MQQMKRLVRVGWLIGVAFLLVILCIGQESEASTWGYQPDSPVGQCLAVYSATNKIPIEVFSDRASAYDAASADCDQCDPQNSCGRGSNSCVCPGWGDPPDYCHAWGYYDCNPSAACTTCNNSFNCGISLCGYSTYGCRTGFENGRNYGLPLYNSYFVYPKEDCPDYVPPVPEQDPKQEVKELRLGGPSCSNSAGNPVTITLGNKYESAIDLSVTSPGIPLELARHYNSLLAGDGPFAMAGLTVSAPMSRL